MDSDTIHLEDEQNWIDRGCSQFPTAQLPPLPDVYHLMRLALRLGEDALSFGEVSTSITLSRRM